MSCSVYAHENRINTCTKRYLVSSALAALLFICQAAAGQSYFEPVNALTPQQQFDSTCRVYYKKIRQADSTDACTALAQLLSTSRKENNPLLEAAAYALSGDYYAKMGQTSKATAFLQQALSLSEGASLYLVQALSHQTLGEINYNTLKDSLSGFSELLKASDLVKNKAGYQNYYPAAQLLAKIGFIYFDFSNYGQAKEYFLQAIRYRFADPEERVNVYNTIGIVYMKTSRPDSAIYYFKTTLSIAETSHMSAWTGIAGGNLGYMYFKQKRYKEAAVYFRRDADLSLANKQWSSAALALSSLAEIDISQGNLVLASQRMDSAKRFSALQNNVNGRYKINSVLALLYAGRKQFDSAYHSADSALQLFKEISELNKSMVLSGAEKKAELDKHLAALRLLRAESQSRVNSRNYIILTCVLILVILVQVMYRIRTKHKKERQAFGELKERLQGYITSIREKNAMILAFKEKIESMTLLTELQEEKKEEITDKLKKFTILTEEQWDEFRHLFEKVHKNFAKNLKTGYDTLTPSEVRLLMLLKLDLSKNEMADMLGVSPDSIKKTRQRIYKKINLPDNIRLEQFVSEL